MSQECSKDLGIKTAYGTPVPGHEESYLQT